jgi:hypothetical protein
MSDERAYQQRYWAMVTQIRARIIYLRFYRDDAAKKDRWLNIGLTVVSSTSLAAWAVSQSVPWLWALLIALTHVIQSTKRFLPFERRAKEIASLQTVLSRIALDAERDWYRVAEGRLTNEEINELLADLRQREQEAEEEHLTATLPDRDDLRRKAARRAEIYFQRHYTLDYERQENE